MKGGVIYRRSAIIICTIILCLFFLTKCISKSGKEDAAIETKVEKEFTGSVICANCHKDIYAKHLTTRHYLTSRPASETYIKGNFQTGENEFFFSDSLLVRMTRKDSSFYQTELVNGVEKRSGRLDIVVGSGAKGQSYLSWSGNRLSQLPITYFTAEQQWSNSPGYPPSRVVYNRPITSRCLECHTTYVEKISAPKAEPEEFDHNRIIYGIDCEKCHGPGGKHVEFQSQNPGDTTGRYIIDPTSLTRQQNVEMCALCHGGRLSKSRPSFEFTAGDKLADYFFIDTASKDATNIDVHGNQSGLLSASKCFKMSTMTCNTCHNTHENERGRPALFSQRCMACHSETHGNFCKMGNVKASLLKQNCIDCHMPQQFSKAIAVFLQGDNMPTSALMRTHIIKVYPGETGKVLAAMKKIQTAKRAPKKVQ